jgi:hypothetical protein
MNFKSLAIQNLKDYKLVRTGIENLRDKITDLEETIDGLRATSYDMDKIIAPGKNTEEDRLIKAMDQVTVLKPALRYKERELERMEKAFQILTAEQRLILDRFHVNRPENHIDILCEELKIEKSQVYNLHDAALRAFTRAMYALVDG